MSSKRSVICPYCSESFLRDRVLWVKQKNRYWHKECWERYLTDKEKEKQDFQKLLTYINKLYGFEKTPTNIIVHINRMKKEYKFTNSGILGTLKYFYEIKKNSLDKSNNGVGIVPYVYDEAKRYYAQIKKAKQQAEGIKEDELKFEKKEIVIHPPEVITIYNKEIDIDILLLKTEEEGS